MAGVADKNALKAGSFIIFSLLLAVAVFWVVNGIGLDTSRTLLVRFDLAQDVSGLAAGSEVRVGGLKRGRVRQVALDDEAAHVLVEVSLPGDVVVRQGSVAVVQSTITGVSWINFSDLGAGDPLPDDAVVEGRTSGMNSAIAALGELGPGLADLTAELREGTLPRISGMVDRATSTLDTIDSAFNRADQTVGRLDSLLADNRTTIDQTLANLRDASQRLPALVEESQKLVATVENAATELAADLDGTGQRLQRLLDSSGNIAEKADQAADDAAVTVREVRSIVQGNRGKIQQIITRATDASRTLSLAASEIRRSPWRLLYKPDGRQRESMDLYDSARQFAEGAGALQDAAIALEDAANDPTTDAEEVHKLLDALQERFERFDQIEREFFKKLQ